MPSLQIEVFKKVDFQAWKVENWDDRFLQGMGKIGGKKKHCTVYLFTFESYKNRCSSQTIQKTQVQIPESSNLFQNATDLS